MIATMYDVRSHPPKVFICELTTNRFNKNVVTVSQSIIGKPLKIRTITRKPVTYEAAEVIYNKLVSDKQHAGYAHGPTYNGVAPEARAVRNLSNQELFKRISQGGVAVAFNGVGYGDILDTQLRTSLKALMTAKGEIERRLYQIGYIS